MIHPELGEPEHWTINEWLLTIVLIDEEVNIG